MFMALNAASSVSWAYKHIPTGNSSLVITKPSGSTGLLVEDEVCEPTSVLSELVIPDRVSHKNKVQFCSFARNAIISIMCEPPEH